MYCPCGFSFVPVPPNFESEYDAYIVVENKHYQEFLEKEVEIVNCTDEGEARLIRIVDSSRLTGSIRLCPNCARLYVSLPGKEDTWYYKRESTWTYPNDE